MRIKFRLNKFRAIARWLDKKLSKPLAFFLKGWLYGLETLWIDYKVSSAVDEGIAPIKPSDPVIEPPRYHSEPSEVDGLDIIKYTYEFTRPRGKNQD